MPDYLCSMYFSVVHSVCVHQADTQSLRAENAAMFNIKMSSYTWSMAAILFIFACFL